MLPNSIPLVEKAAQGEVFGIFDGVGGAPAGMAAAQFMADCLIRFFSEPAISLDALLRQSNIEICDWGYIEGTQRPRGACAGTVVWFKDEIAKIFHCGDTSAVRIPEGDTPRLLTSVHQQTDGALSNYFGLGSDLYIEKAEVSLNDEEVVLLMTDGVTKAMSAVNSGRWLQAEIARGRDALNALCELVELARRKGSKDDITALLISRYEFE